MQKKNIKTRIKKELRLFNKVICEGDANFFLNINKSAIFNMNQAKTIMKVDAYKNELIPDFFTIIKKCCKKTDNIATENKMSSLYLKTELKIFFITLIKRFFLFSTSIL